MKISTRQYAIALYQSLVDVPAKEMNGIIKNFVMLLAKDHVMSKVDQIMSDFKTYANSQQGITEVTVSTAKELTAADRTNLQKDVQKITDTNVEIIERVIPQLISGIRLQVGDTVIDSSVAASLSRLHNQLTSN